MIVGCEAEENPSASHYTTAQPSERLQETASTGQDGLVPDNIGEETKDDLPIPPGMIPYSIALKPWKGDYSDMVERRMIRILVPYSRSHYFVDGATERGIVAAAGRALQKTVNEREGLTTRPVQVVFIPTPRNDLIDHLNEGLGDIAAGSLVVTNRRRAEVDFSDPFFRTINKVLCTGPGSKEISHLDELAGRTLYVQPHDSSFDAISVLSNSFVERGMEPIDIRSLDASLEPDEILEYVESGLIGSTVMDQHQAEFWAQIFPDITVRLDLVVADGLNIAWAFRKESPELSAVVNNFVRSHRQGTEFGNIMLRRYLQSDRWIGDSPGSANLRRYEQIKPLLEEYGEKYGVDPMILAALAYQESRMDQSVRSPVGAIGVMQLMPATGRSLEVGDITDLESNIHAGTKYLKQLMNRFDGLEMDPLNQTLFALASYNGGQTRIRRLRNGSSELGLDPNRWFYNVELSSARVIGRENVQYVRNIYRYYLAFRLIEQRRAEREGRSET